MAIEIMPRAALEPVRSQTGGAQGNVAPMQDAGAATTRALGEGIGDVGRALTVAADRAQDHIDAGMELDASAIYTEEDEKAYDGPGGYLTTVGRDAVNLDNRKKAEERMRQKREAVEKTLQNNQQKLAFKAHANHIDARSRSRANAHYEQQSRVYEGGGRKASADAGVREAIKFAGTEEGEAAFQIALRNYDEWGALTGMHPAEIENEKQKATDEYHTGVLGRIVTEGKNPPLARLYLDKHKGALSPDAEARASGFVQRASVQDTAMRAVDEMAGKGMTADQMRGWAQVAHQSGNLTAEERAAIEDRATWHGRQQAHAAAAAENGVRAAAEAWLTANPLQAVSAMPPELLDAVTTTGQIGDINQFAKTRRYTTDPQTFLRALRTTDEEWRSVTREQVVRAWRGKLDDQDLEKVLDMHEAAMQPKYNKLSILSPERMVEDTARRIGILPADPKDDGTAEQAAAYQQFRLDFNAQLNTWQDNHKKRAEEADVQKLLDARAAAYKQKVLVRESELTSGFGEFFWRGLDALGGDPDHMDRTLVEVEMGSLTDAQQGRAFVRTGAGKVMALKDIPEGKRDRIRRYIESKGEVATLSKIVDYYLQDQ